MSCADIINSSGLFLDIVGVALLFLYGLGGGQKDRSWLFHMGIR